MKAAAEGALMSGGRAETVVALGGFRLAVGGSFWGCGNFDDAMGGHNSAAEMRK